MRLRSGDQFDRHSLDLFGGGDEIGHRSLFGRSEVAAGEGVAEWVDPYRVALGVETPPVTGRVADSGGDAATEVSGGEELMGLVGGVDGGMKDDERLPAVATWDGEPVVQRG